MNSLLRFAFLAAWMVVFACDERAVAADRVALIIGSEAYPAPNALPNPPHDAASSERA